MNTPGSEPLRIEKQEKYAQAVAAGLSETVAYMRVYEMHDRKVAMRSVYRIKKNTATMNRIEFLKKGKSGEFKSEGVDLKSAIETCKDVIDRSDSMPQRMKAIEVLNKLGVFDGENKDDGKRMDPSAICEYLARFAGNPAKELGMIPGGLKGMLVRLMELTGATYAQMRDALSELATSPASEPSKLPEDPPDKPDEDGDLEDDETLVPVITAAPSTAEEQEISEAMALRLKPALELCGKLSEKPYEQFDPGPDQGTGPILEF